MDEVNDAQAWEWTLDVDRWIWKQIRDRRIPEQDREDVYNLCVIEIFTLMKRYNPKYSKVSWANFGILKALKEYESTSGAVRLPFHVLEKMAVIRKYVNQCRLDGIEPKEEEMEHLTGMKMRDIVVARDRYAIINSLDHEGNVVDFSSATMNVDPDSMKYVYDRTLEPEESAGSKDEMDYIYRNMGSLLDIDIYVLTLKYGLDKNKVPPRESFSEGGDFDMSEIVGSVQFSCGTIAKRIGYTRERIRQIESRAVSKIQQKLGIDDD